MTSLGGTAAALALAPLFLGVQRGQAQEYSLTIPTHDAKLKAPVEAVLDLKATLGIDPGPQNPYVYDCVAFLRVLRRGSTDTVRLQRAGPGAWTRDVVWVGLADDPSRRRRPRLLAFVGPKHETLVVVLDPENSQAQYEVGVDSAVVIDSGVMRPDSGALHGVQSLVTDPFTIPPSELTRCGRVPHFETNLLAPDGEHPGWGLDYDIVWRRPLRVGGGGLFQFGARGGFTTSAKSVLLNAVTSDARLDIKLTKGWQHWISAGVAEGLEATERFDVVDLTLGVTSRIRLDFLPLDALRPLLRRFTPYPTLTLEYNFVDRVKGASAAAVAGRPESEHRVRAGFEWMVPAIMRTTLRAKVRADYLLSAVPAGQSRLRTLHEISVEYPLDRATDTAVVVEWLVGRAPPAYQLVTRWLTGIGLRF